MNIPTLYHVEKRLGDSTKKQQPYWKLFQSFTLLLPEHALPTETTGLADWWHMMSPLRFNNSCVLYFTPCSLSIHWMEALYGNSHPMVTIVQASGSNMLDVLHEDLTS